MVTFEPDGDVHGLHPVAVHHVLEHVLAVRDLGDGVAEPPLGAGDDFVERGADHFRGVEIHDLEEASRAQAARSDLRVVVAATLLRHPHVEQQQVHDVALQLASPEEPDDRDAQALLVDLAHPARHRPRRHAPDVGVVREVGDEAEQLSLDEHRHRVVDVGQMGAARGVRVVGDEEVSVVDVARELLQQAGDESAHRRDVDGQRLGRLRDEPAVPVHDGGGVVAALLDVGGVRRLHQRDEGLVGDRAQRVGDDLEGDRIDAVVLRIRAIAGVDVPVPARAPVAALAHGPVHVAVHALVGIGIHASGSPAFNCARTRCRSASRPVAPRPRDRRRG